MDGKDLQMLKGVGEKRAKLFKKLGVESIDALLGFYPRAYTDYSAPYTIALAPFESACAVQATVVKKTKPLRISGGRTMVRVICEDETATLTITLFNNPYAAAALAEGESYIFYGRFSGTMLSRTASAPQFIKAGGQAPLAPIYPLTSGLSSKAIANAVKAALEAAGDMKDPLPQHLLFKYSLCSKSEALRTIHFPKNMGDVERARNRLIFEELLVLQTGLMALRKQDKQKSQYVIKRVDSAAFFSKLPFEPTGAQLRATREIEHDFAGGAPMNRLLQGDVGSGKTLVAAAAMYGCAKAGYQVVLMAPTDILANQHAATLTQLFAPHGMQVVLLTAATKGAQRKAVLAALKSGEAKIIVGTHAVISEAVEFAKLALVITDEQHRFGVNQRAQLTKKGHNPHTLVMSATPIPRTLALIIFGDLDISIIDEMPKNRAKIKTYTVGSSLRARMFGFIEKEAKAGHSVFIVCPRIEEGEAEDGLNSVVTYYEEVAKKLLPTIGIGLLHGKLKAAEKQSVMQRFLSGETPVLCSTTVVEVGVDVPKATVMVIENAERYGLSALHQLRGRVGRANLESYCILVSDAKSETAKKRLDYMCKTSSGFDLAKYDLDTRGPGDFFGSRQHGLPQLKAASLLADSKLLYSAQQEARAIMAADPELENEEHKGIKALVANLYAGSASALN